MMVLMIDPWEVVWTYSLNQMIESRPCAKRLPPSWPLPIEMESWSETGAATENLQSNTLKRCQCNRPSRKVKTWLRKTCKRCRKLFMFESLRPLCFRYQRTYVNIYAWHDVHVSRASHGSYKTVVSNKACEGCFALNASCGSRHARHDSERRTH